MTFLGLVGFVCLAVSRVAADDAGATAASAFISSGEYSNQLAADDPHQHGEFPSTEASGSVDAIARRLIAWIVENTDYFAPEPPRIVREDERALAKRYYGESFKPDSPLRVEALYDYSAETVYLCDCWRANDIFDEGRLLHELVHHVQHRNNAQAPCRGALEAESYALHAEWLAEHGVKRPYAAIGTDRFTIGVLSSCEDE